MIEYLSYKFDDNQEFIDCFDELPLWSAPFGLLLLKHLELKPNLTVIDLGSGSGFPLIELAERLGKSCKLFGLDPWTNGNKRARQKIKSYGLANVQIIEGSAEQIPFEENSVDLIVSNLGINNFSNPQAVFKECNRVLITNGKFAFTTNLNGHWKEFYNIFYSTLRQLGNEHLIPILKQEEEHRATTESASKMLMDSGLKVTRLFQESFEMKFLNGSTFLNHHFIKFGWLTSWINIFPKEELMKIFSALEHNLNHYSQKSGGLTLTVPMVFIEGEK